MSQTGKSFEDFLRWKKEQQMRGGRRYKDESSSETDSSVEEVRYSKRSVSNKKKYYDESDSSSSSSSDDDRRRRRRSTQVSSSREVRRDRSSKSSKGRRNRDDSSSEEDVVIVNNRRVKSRGSRREESSRSTSKRNHRQYDESSSDDDRYNRNVDSDDSDDSGRRRRPTVSKRSTSTKRSTSSRSKSEHNTKRNTSRGRRDDSSSEEAPRRVQAKKKLISKRPPAQNSDSSSDEEVVVRTKTTKKSNTPTKSTKSPTQSKPEHKLSIHKKTKRDSSSSSSSSSSSDDEKITKKPTIKSKQSTSEINFDYALWLDNWDKTYTNKDKDPKKKRSLLKELLQQIENMTDSACHGTKFVVQEKNSNDTKSYQLDAASLAPNVKKTTLYAYHHLEKYIPTEKGATKTTAHFVKSDILDVGLFVKKEIKRNPLVLVMGDARIPGGKDHRCLFGEEISIWRRTALREFLESDRRRKYFKEGEKDTFVYDIPQNGAVYCPNVPVFRGNSKKGYSFTAPETLSFVVIPPVMNPELVNDRLKEEDVEIIRKKLTMIFLVALANKHDAVVVTAFGCGYAQNPPKHVAEIFNEVIAKFRNHFSNILFAIIDNANARKNNPEGNIQPFNNAFGHLQKKPSQNGSNSNLTKEQKEKLDN